MNTALQQKIEQVAQLGQMLDGAKIVVLADFQGVNVADISQLRRDVRKAKGNMKVAKNTLVRRVAAGDGLAAFRELLVGQNALAYSQEDPIEVVKTLVDFAKNNPKFKVKGGILEGAVLDEPSLTNLAKLPGRPQLLAMFMGALNGPIGSVMGVMNASTSSLLSQLKGIEEKLASGSEASGSSS